MSFLRNISLSVPNCTPALEITGYKFNCKEHIVAYVNKVDKYKSVQAWRLIYIFTEL